MLKLLSAATPESSLSADLGLLFFRLVAGLTMAFSHGFGKLPPSDQFIEGVTGMGFPAPVVFAWAASLSEFLGGLFIALGLFTRASSAFLAFTMAIAVFVAHAADPFQKKEMAILYGAIAIFFFFHGSGRYSVDAKLR